MLTLFRKLLGKPQPQQPKQPKVSASNAAQYEAIPSMPTVEVAQLSLAAIIARLPEDLQALVRQQPGAEATVALPLPTIVKQLPSGAVKISLATLHRQAPAGVFAPLAPGDKRMVSVPLSEIFRHVSPFTLKRRMDQRPAQLPSSEFNLFGSSTNPFAITGPDEDEPTTLVIDESVEPAITPRFPTEPTAPRPGARVIAPPSDYFAPSHHRVAPSSQAEPRPAPEPAVPKSNLPPLRLPLAPLAAAWPDEIKGELAALNGSASVLLPADEVSAGLAKGKVIFTWGQLRNCVEPALESASAVDDATPLTLPLKVVAPAFMAAARQPKSDAKKVTVGEDIPVIFSDNRAPAVPAAEETVEGAPAIELAPDATPAAEEQPAFQLASDAEPVKEPASDQTDEGTPVLEAAPMPDESHVSGMEETAEAAPALALVSEPEELPQPVEVTSAEAEALQHPPAPAEEGLVAPAGATARSIGEIFGDPDREQWTPAEIVARLPKLPGVVGAVVALQEGLLVAHSLPEDVKGEAIAAFLPQVFARLNQYSGEMKLGEVDDLLFTTRGAHCQIYRLGIVYFAILGKPGESLPWQELRLIAGELAKQTQPS